MRLSWNEVRAGAAPFAEEWRDAAYAEGETQILYNAFFDVFGVRRRTVRGRVVESAKLSASPQMSRQGRYITSLRR